MNKRTIVVIALAFIAGMGMLFAAAQAEKPATAGEVLTPATYTWAAGGVGGGWYTQAGGMATIVKNNVPEITIKVIPGGGVSNPLKLNSGEDDFGWGVSYVDKAAYNGTPPLFDKPYPNFYGLLGNFSVDFYHFFAAKETGITTLEEFVAKVKAGEKINLAAPMIGTSERALTSLIFEHHGISYEQIEKNGGRVIYAVYGDMVNLYKDRHVDYVIACLSLPGAAITEMAISRDSVLLSVTDETVKYAASLGTVPFESGLNVIPGGTYSGIPHDVQAIGHSTEVCATAGLPEIVAYHFVKVLIENIEEVKDLNPSFKKYFTAENAPNTAVPLHPGAERYYREVGLLK